jgi:MscS family membrane protein
MEFSSLYLMVTANGNSIKELLYTRWWGIAVWQYVIALILLIISAFARKTAEYLFNNYGKPWLERIGSHYTSAILHALLKPFSALLGLFGIYCSVLVLIYPSSIEDGGIISGSIITSEWINQLFQVAIAIIVIWALLRLVDVMSIFMKDKAKQDEVIIEAQIIPLLRKSLKIFIALIGGLIIIQHLGYPVASLLGGLGLGGLAVALAAQDTLSNIFGSLIIFTDKPFKVGDWIRIGEVDGDVESIGFRSTKIRTWPKTLVTIPNRDVANSRIENWSAMPKRRVKFTFFVRHTTTAEKMTQLVNGIRHILTHHPDVNQEYLLVNFIDFTETGLGILVYYFTNSTVWKEHMQVREEINLEIMKLTDDLQISLAIPPRVIYNHKEENQA